MKFDSAAAVLAAHIQLFFKLSIGSGGDEGCRRSPAVTRPDSKQCDRETSSIV